MASAFSRSMRSLEADTFRRATWSIVTAALLLLAGATWFVFGRIDVYETTRQARIEVEREAHPVATQSSGRVTVTHLILGQQVNPGDILVELESETERLQVEEERTRLAAFTSRREALRVQIDAEERAWPEEQKTAALAITEGRAREKEAESAAQFAEGEAARTKRLREERIASEADLQRADTEAQKLRATATAGSMTVSRLESEAKSKENNHGVRLAQLRRELAQLEGEIATSATTVKRHEHNLEQRRIRAPIAGQLGEVASLRVGSFLNAGDKIGAIIPPGKLRAIAQFAPWSALGRIRPGQPARLRLEGFPWAQFGTVSATVASVATEPRDGAVRVEFAVQTNTASAIPYQHGLPGAIEVQVERVAPATLVLRAAGKLVAKPRAEGAR